jgi:N12 class adenine-specific DNA methylase
MAILKNSEKMESNLGLNSNLNQKVTLIDGTFSPSDAKKTLNNIVDEQANYKVLQNLSNWIGNHQDDGVDMDQLKIEKEKINNLILSAQQNGYKIEIKGNFSLKVVK